MTPATQESYRKLAANFYKKRLPGQPLSPKRIADALKESASEYRPAYWRRLRNALAFDQSERGYVEAAERINKTANPVTKSGGAVKPKQPRTRRVTDSDQEKLLARFIEMEDRGAYSAIEVARITGARPAELKNMSVEGSRITIHSAKKSHQGTRGADRVIEVSESDAELVGLALEYLRGDIGPIQDRIRAAGKSLWPQRKSIPTLYSWRHQLGSELKASGLDRRIIAYIMGHQATASVDQYGNPRMAKGGRVLPKPAAGSELETIRVTHGFPPEPGVVKAVSRSNEKSRSKWDFDSPGLG